MMPGRCVAWEKTATTCYLRGEIPMIEKQLSIFLENKPGVLAEVARTLGEHGVNIRGLSVSDTVDYAAQPVRRHRQQRADRRAEKNRGNGQLDDSGNCAHV